MLPLQSKGLSTEHIDPPTTDISPLIDYVGNKIRENFTGSCLKQSNKLTYAHKTIVKIYIVYELGASTSNDNNPILKNCLFGAVALTKKQILISMGILAIELDLIEDQVFHFQVLGLAKMQTSVLLLILTIRIKTY